MTCYFNGELLKEPTPENGSMWEQLEALGVSHEEYQKILGSVFKEYKSCCKEFESLMDVTEPIVDYGTKEVLG